MRIFARKTLRFDDPNKKEAPVVVRALEFSDVPDWVQQSTMFKWAVEEESLTVVQSKADELQAQNSYNDAVLKDLQATAKDLGIKGYTKMTKDQLAAAIEAATKNGQQVQAAESSQPAGENQAGD